MGDATLRQALSWRTFASVLCATLYCKPLRESQQSEKGRYSSCCIHHSLSCHGPGYLFPQVQIYGGASGRLSRSIKVWGIYLGWTMLWQLVNANVVCEKSFALHQAPHCDDAIARRAHSGEL
eukprot:3534377-Amphidinium_carterae.1